MLTLAIPRPFLGILKASGWPDTPFHQLLSIENQ
jgi:hypothetical protein